MGLRAHAAVAYGDDGSVDNWHPSPSAQCLYLPLLFVRIVDLLFVSRQTPVLSRKVICITSMRSVKTPRLQLMTKTQRENDQLTFNCKLNKQNWDRLSIVNIQHLTFQLARTRVYVLTFSCV